MSYCLNPRCLEPQNTHNENFCVSCGSKLLLKERYRAIRPIGHGGFGRTFLAVDEDKPSQPQCVIKQLHPQSQGTSTLNKALQLFTQEAMRLDELGKHPQIPELLAYFTQDDRHYLLQEFIRGNNLAEELKQSGIFQEELIIELLLDLLPVLQFCHSKQVIHRDIKPENIIQRVSYSHSGNNQVKKLLTGKGNLVLVDFGASKVATSTALNRTGTSIGSPEYVAPEQIRGKAIFASDIYSLGVTCIFLLTGKSPFDLFDVNNAVWIWQQYAQYPISKSLCNILDKMLETIPARRYQTVEQVINDINSLSSSSKKSIISPDPKKSSTPISKAVSSQVDIELEEIKTQFLNGKSNKNKHKKQNRNHNNSANQSTNSGSQNLKKDKIDTELDEIRSKFLENKE
ncbi:MAG: serine/threonine-protein kinase [Cyanobacteria bacterium P01_A01_bin.45]|mgnify:CR=1 FL=1